MDTPELVPAATLSDAELAALFTAAYADYYVPVQIDEAALAFMVRAFDVDLGASRVARRDGEAIGLCMLGLRGEEAWIGGLGVAAGARRGGVARVLTEAVLDAARERGAREVRLEVIVENDRAIPLYERLGFDRTRVLEVWTLGGADGSAPELPADEAHAWIREHRRTREPWQRDDATLSHLDGLVGLRVGRGAAVVRVANGRAAVQQIAGDEAAGVELLASARALGESLSALNIPEGDPASAAFRSLGGQLAVRQYEMALRL